ncbi:hypothetical protein ACC713_20315 [Rhizobium johnstonii]|uniref:hypothetical protein n=1 Tax=Rhizobium johnstonii TaxID=3019933 RepID=UPI003F95B0EC
MADAVSKPGLDANGLLPANHNPASVPSDEDGKQLIPAVPMSGEVRQAILVFDAAAVSDRKYDLINCLDGMTFGFGNWPQAEIGAFFTGMQSTQPAAGALVKRTAEVLQADRAAGKAFATAANISDRSLSNESISNGLKRLLADSRRRNARVSVTNDGRCRPRPSAGVSFYQDHKSWLLPVLRRAFRDPAIVAYQVAYWESDVLTPARNYARKLGVSGPTTFLLAFYESNPGQAPEVGRLVRAGRPPTQVRVGGAWWDWAVPPDNVGSPNIEQWHSLLLWQAMCPANTAGFPIRNRNLSYFALYLAHDFKLPREAMRQGSFFPQADSRENCNPAKVKPR